MTQTTRRAYSLCDERKILKQKSVGLKHNCIRMKCITKTKIVISFQMKLWMIFVISTNRSNNLSLQAMTLNFQQKTVKFLK